MPTSSLRSKATIDRAGVGCEPASAASLAGVKLLRERAVIRAGERVVAILTGHILKDPGILQQMHQDQTPPAAWANAPIRIQPTIAAVRRVLDATIG